MLLQNSKNVKKNTLRNISDVTIALGARLEFWQCAKRVWWAVSYHVYNVQVKER
jgi:hypothetical protein